MCVCVCGGGGGGEGEHTCVSICFCTMYHSMIVLNDSANIAKKMQSYCPPPQKYDDSTLEYLLTY